MKYIKGGIYKDKEYEKKCFICLLKDKRIYYGVDIDDCTEFSNLYINTEVYQCKIENRLDELNYWYLRDLNGFENISDGYLGKIDKELYNDLISALKEDTLWEDFH